MRTGRAHRANTLQERFDEPQTLDLSGLPDESPILEAGVLVGEGADVQGQDRAVYAVRVAGIETIEVPAGSLAGTLHVRIGLGGPFFGVQEGEEITAFSNLWAPPEQLIVRWAPSPGVGWSIELLTPWE